MSIGPMVRKILRKLPMCKVDLANQCNGIFILPVLLTKLSQGSIRYLAYT